MVIRRLQKVGASTFTVALPKEWVIARGLGPKSEVDLQILDDGNIRISTLSSVKRREKEIIIKSKEEDAGFLIRRVLAAYIAGYDIIRIDLSAVELNLEGREKLRRTVKYKMAGAEIIEESTNGITVQIILRPYEFPMNKILLRMTDLTHSMIMDICKALISKNRDILLDVIERDDDVDKLYFMGSRWLASIMEEAGSPIDYDIRKGRELLEYRLIFRHVERVADHVCKIATKLLELIDILDGKVLSAIREELERSGSVFVRSINSIGGKNINEANKTIHEARAVVKNSEEIVERIGKDTPEVCMGALAIIADSIKRIAEYGIGISEIAFNLSAES
ncbi:MAG: phosphate uptake regulator PhoU [Candidatus Methanomethylicia archaeon]|jgi:phosphate uptake regulator|nr:phosphate uptake regulator PhoU [Candidatus Methanomethylicia archaeon]